MGVGEAAYAWPERFIHWTSGTRMKQHALNEDWSSFCGVHNAV